MSSFNLHPGRSPLPRTRRCGYVSLRLGHAAALTTIQVVIHYRVAASLPAERGRKNKNTSPQACFFDISFAYFFITSYAPAGTYFSYDLPYFIISRTNVELINDSAGVDARMTVSTPPISIFISASDIS